MTIAISLDIETERLARKLAEVTGKPLPTVVKEAIEAKAEAAGVEMQQLSARLSREDRLARMMEAARSFDSIPVLDPRSADEIIGYDELGLPK